jgi:hypothetical protein
VTDSAFRQDAVDRQNMAVDIGVLQTQMASVLAGQSDQKRVNADQSAQLQRILDELATARGGWRTLLWLGGAAASAGGLVAWISQHITFR